MAHQAEPLPYDGHQSTPHGTTVADILLTVAPDVQLYSADVFGPQGSCDVEVVMRALHWAINVWKCKVLNLSLGVAESRILQLPRRQQLQRAIEEAYYKDVADLRRRTQRAPADAKLSGRLRPAAVVRGQASLRRPAWFSPISSATRSNFRPTAAATSALRQEPATSWAAPHLAGIAGRSVAPAQFEAV